MGARLPSGGCGAQELECTSHACLTPPCGWAGTRLPHPALREGGRCLAANLLGSPSRSAALSGYCTRYSAAAAAAALSSRQARSAWMRLRRRARGGEPRVGPARAAAGATGSSPKAGTSQTVAAAAGGARGRRRADKSCAGPGLILTCTAPWARRPPTRQPAPRRPAPPPRRPPSAAAAAPARGCSRARGPRARRGWRRCKPPPPPAAAC